MKYAFFLFFYLFIFKANGQISFTDLLSVYKMNTMNGEFRKFAVKKKFENCTYSNDINGRLTTETYSKGSGANNRELELILATSWDGPIVNYRSTFKNEFISIKEQAFRIGFKYVYTEKENGNSIKVYKKGSLELAIYINEEYEYTPYNITLRTENFNRDFR